VSNVLTRRDAGSAYGEKPDPLNTQVDLSRDVMVEFDATRAALGIPSRAERGHSAPGSSRR
jgi:hypothetical protein